MKRQQIATAAAIIALVYLSILWPLTAGAQEVPPETPQISATWWVPTDTPEPPATPTVTRRPTPTPSMTPTPVIVRPFPLGPCKLAPGCVLLPLVVTP